jgi:osmoprotectant transport system substrate-binding protein
MDARRTGALFAILMAAGALGASPAADTAARGPITVGSKIDTEGSLLGQMIVLLLRDAGFTVVDKVQLGTTDVVRKAIISGEIDIYPEYTGNGGFFFQGVDPAVWKDPDKGYETVKRLDMETNRLVWLPPAAADNTWAVAVRRDLAEREKIASWDDFAAYVRRGGTVKLAASEEFASRPDALPSFEQAYDLKLGKAQLLVLSGGNTATTTKAAAERTDGVNAAMAYGTDGQLAALGLVVLADTRHVQPVYEPAPLVRADVAGRYPEIAAILAPAFARLDLVTLQLLNSRIAVEGRGAADVAREYLASQGLLTTKK